ncbi:TerC family protein, partial [Bacillus subtilis]|uniref:TerC family protein n=1 Tax=Bacillus subtilis TaxID=1423 RepID=UPI00092A7FB1
MEHDYLISLLGIVGIDLILGGDNAVVIAMASRHWPDKQGQQAIILGTFIDVVIIVGITTASVYLLYFHL